MDGRIEAVKKADSATLLSDWATAKAWLSSKGWTATIELRE